MLLGSISHSTTLLYGDYIFSDTGIVLNFVNSNVMASIKIRDNILKTNFAAWKREWLKQWKYLSLIDTFIFSVEVFQFPKFHGNVDKHIKRNAKRIDFGIGLLSTHNWFPFSEVYWEPCSLSDSFLIFFRKQLTR